jgi:nucleoside-diphosphate-sugar epimerase
MKPLRDLAGLRVLVTGGNGFLGRAIVDKLRARGARLRSLQRSDCPELRAIGVETCRGGIEEPGCVAAAVADCDLVIHTAAKAGIWGAYRDFREINLVGTLNVIDACRRGGVRRLVFTSTPSVVFDGADLEGVDESAPYPPRFQAAYPETKASAERAVLAANGPDLATVSLRPHLIWGPGDPHFVPRIVGRARAGRLRMVGDGRNRVDTIYIDNAADAHVLAAERLEVGSAIAGKAYFLSQGEPIAVGEMIDHLLRAAGAPPLTRSVPVALAHAAGTLLELVYRALRARREPLITRFLARELSTSHWFDITAARRDLEYAPVVSLEVGLRRLTKWLEENPFGVGVRSAPSHE